MRRLLIWAGLAFVLTGAGWNVWSNERILADGRVVLFELAPVDPRSLMQGDYMALDYAIGRKLTRASERDDGYVIVRLDEQRVAEFVRTQPETRPFTTDEIAIHYRVRRGRFQFATNAFFFQEGTGEKFEPAHYGEFRVDDNGEPRLTALLDQDFQRLGDNRY